MRLALVVQRYGREITGGAEFHARLVAEHLAKRHEVVVLTTCASDYVTWSNWYPAGIADVNGITVWRFPVRRPRNPDRFGRLQQRVFHRPHRPSQARAWLDEQGPYCPAMLRWIETNRDRFDYFFCFSYRYWTTFHAMQAVAGRGILVPTAEPDPAIEMPLFHENFREARAIVYNSEEERQMIVQQTGNHSVPGEVVGVGVVEPPEASSDRFRAERGIQEPFVLYIGRIDANKGCNQLFSFYRRAFQSLAGSAVEPPLLLLAGSPILSIPEHSGIHFLGRIDEREKYDALSTATALIMPSFYESLSMVLLEAWAMSRPVLVNGHCGVLRGQAIRSRGGLFYMDAEEFTEALRLLMSDERLRMTLGNNGRAYYESSYRWPVIESKYERLLEKLSAENRR